MKTHRFLFTLTLSSLFLEIVGQEVSETLAQRIAANYYNKVQNDNQSKQIEDIKTSLVNQTRNKCEKVSLLNKAYMWLVPVADGWVLVSSSLRTVPILAHYQTDKKPDVQSLSPAEKELLAWYEETIAYVKDSCANCDTNSKWERYMQDNIDTEQKTNSRSSVSPLIKTSWSQDKSYDVPDCNRTYNKFCPPSNDSTTCYKSRTGCVNVALGQILRYWEWPFCADGPNISNNSIIEMHFYQWDKMPKYISNSTPMDMVDMVALLLRDCGYNTNTNYSNTHSSANIRDAYNCFLTLGYDSLSLSYLKKWETSGWRDLLHTELNARRPVFYSARTKSIGGEGHSFVVDGYNSEDLYHLNLGFYDPRNNSFYNIDTISNPVCGNLIHWQRAIFGIKPNPHCGPLSYNNRIVLQRFCYVSGGELTLNNVIVASIVDRGEATSSTQVRITNGSAFLSGCNVRIGIKDVPCNNSSSSAPAQLRDEEQLYSREEEVMTLGIVGQDALSVLHNPATDHISVSCSEVIAKTAVYSINGQLVLQTVDTDINVSFLPAGVYVVHAYTSNGQLLTSKFVHL